jgi:hypothetical protein
MGKLADLWAELKEAKPEHKDEIKKKINAIEQWCIDNKFGDFKEITDWNKPMKKKKKSGSFEPMSFTEDNGFITVGNFILPMSDFCSHCGIYKYNGLIAMNGEFIHV